jgi:CheY-like chemotaxis protein
VLRDPRADDAIRARAFEALDRATEVQRSMIDELLDVTRVVTGVVRLSIGDVDMVALAASTVETLHPEAAAKAIEVRTHFEVGEARVAGDEDRLRQVLANVIGNAVKYTGAGGRIAVTVRQAGATVQVSVADTGQGIDPAFLPRIFDRFSQDPSTPWAPGGGLGLGLAIARRLVDLHGGTITAHSAGSGRGATFTIELPAAPRRDTFEPVRPDAALLAGRRAIVVDDDEDTAELIATILRQHGVQVRTASTARPALALLDEWLPDLVVCDIGLPDMDGYEFVRRARAHPRARALCALAITGYVRREDRQRALDAGFDAHLAKPVHPDDLLREVCERLGRPAAHRPR